MRSTLFILSLLIFAGMTLPATQASAGPGLGGGYKSSLSSKKVVKRRTIRR